MTAGREVCPLPPWGVSNGRTVGSVNIYTCGKGTVGGGSATCLPSKEWDKKIDTTCTPILAHPCKNDSLCSEINGYCSAKGQCECEPSKIYDETSKECVVECADGWEKFGVHCYLFNNDPLSWEKAKIHCTQLGSNLLKVEDAPEHEFAKAKCAEYGTIYYWIGARWSTEYGEYRWYDDTVMNYTVWSPGEPDIKRGCVDMLVSVDWAWNSHHDCSNTNGSSICEKG
ncbi:type-2 ice-structuring protein-like [Mercenaria mercenaria]|uniref:type-2 ice-structuring protein-like n=1 Tax=Mercenaria mercenaria TaxID=6596 RepID=UPI00234EF2A2|nr:type-2 ice-structuring protein-like [Mercenaria mercenaria]